MNLAAVQKKEREADAQVFRDAAKFCEDGKNQHLSGLHSPYYDGACDVLSVYHEFDRHDLRDRFYDRFVAGEGFFLACQMFRGEADPQASGQQWRILALCFRRRDDRDRRSVKAPRPAHACCVHNGCQSLKELVCPVECEWLVDGEPEGEDEARVAVDELISGVGRK